MDKVKINISGEFYNNGDFHIYAGTLENFDEVSVKTDGFTLPDGDNLLAGVMGKYQNKKSFICKYVDIDETSKSAQKNILMSINGIKKKTADIILNEIDDINIFRGDGCPKIKGIGPAKIYLIKEGLALLDNMKVFKELNILLGSNASPAQIKTITNIIETLDNGMESFKNNPYEILMDHSDFTFKKADKIALSMGIKLSSEIRKKYLVEYLVKYYTSMGNCYIEKNDLEQKMVENGINGISLNDISENDRLVVDDEKIYTKNMFIAESQIPGKIKNIIDKKTDKKSFDTYNIESMINDFQELNGIKFDEYQTSAIYTAVNNSVSVITGGAGTGKTTLLKCILYCLKETYHNCYLTAPTGKAAIRMQQATGLDSTTIHRFFNMVDDEYTRKNCIMVVDEFSMVDTQLFYDLLSTMEDSCLDFIKLIIVGDSGQLPSVQPGNILYDLLESKTLESIKLEKTFRQKGGSNIIDIATLVRKNKAFEYIQKQDFYVRPANNKIEYVSLIKYFFNYIYKKYDDIDKFYSEVQFVTPMKKGEVGVNSINQIIKNEINPTKRSEKEIKFFPFDLDDKVMCIKNDRLNGIMNGEFGRLTEVSDKHFTIYYKDLNKVITYIKSLETINNFQLSYCSTVHKLQGSEFKYIVFILPQDSPFIDSRLLYTAITRGKETVIMLTNKGITDKVIVRNNLLKRNTNLKNRMIEQFN